MGTKLLLITFFFLKGIRRVNDTTVKWSYGVPTKFKEKYVTDWCFSIVLPTR